jgi:protein-L-isoaspartate(D-aspartate) O-methyltransferase
MSQGNDALAARVAAKALFYLDGSPRSNRVSAALRAVDRAEFIPLEYRDRAYHDDALPIGWGQTCSQPSMVAFMLDKLLIDAGMRLLEVGAGSGYAAAVAAALVGPSGSILACEILPELASMCRSNTARWRDVIEVRQADGSTALDEREGFDRIILSAGVHLPRFKEDPLLDALKDDGVLLYPETMGQLTRVRKTPEGLVRDSWGGVVFVPLKGENA